MQLSYQKAYYAVEGHQPHISLRDVIRHTVRNQGIRGFYGGLGVDLIKVLPTNTILMVSFEFFRHLFKSDNAH